MFQTPKTLWVFLPLLLALVGPARAAGPQLSGRYASDGLGQLEFTTRGDRVSARHLSGGSCPYAANENVLEGEFEGNVLVGTVSLCQAGPSCGSRAYPLLAFYNPEDGALAAHVKLDSGCTSPALQDVLLALSPAREAEPLAAAPTVAQRRRPLEPEHVSKVRRSYKQAADALQKGRYDEAIRHYHFALRYDPDNWAAHLGLGYAEFQRGDIQEAVREYERARELEPTEPDSYYNLACAYARLKDRSRALANLQQAIHRGFDQAEGMARDADLTALLRDDMEFQKLVQKAWTLQDTKKKRQR
jgi:hypothetical protein